jgi:hypothetical protein
MDAKEPADVQDVRDLPEGMDAVKGGVCAEVPFLNGRFETYAESGGVRAGTLSPIVKAQPVGCW